MIRDNPTTLDRTRTDGVPVPRTDREVPRGQPGQAPRRTRPRSEYWDVETARWVTNSPTPAPRQGD